MNKEMEEIIGELCEDWFYGVQAEYWKPRKGDMYFIRNEVGDETVPTPMIVSDSCEMATGFGLFGNCDVWIPVQTNPLTGRLQIDEILMEVGGFNRMGQLNYAFSSWVVSNSHQTKAEENEFYYKLLFLKHLTK